MTADVEDFVLTEEDALDDVARLNTEVVEVRQMFEELRTELRAATARADHAERELQEFKDRVVEVGQQAAEDHDFCAVYDQVMEELGLPGRVRSFDVTIRVTFDTTVTIMGTSLEEAEDAATGRDLKSNWRPGSPYFDDEMQMQTYASNVEVEVV